jgi:hypothetical protein
VAVAMAGAELPLTSLGCKALNAYTYARAWRANAAVICFSAVTTGSPQFAGD